MTTRLRALRGLTYPYGKSVQIIADAGGIRKLRPEVRAELKFKRVEPGEYCDDLPPDVIEPFLRDNKIERVKVRKVRKAHGE